MDRVFSARVDEAALDEMERVIRRLGLTKKEFVEGAIRARARELAEDASNDVWADTLGAWRRNEKPQTTVRRSRRAFEDSFKRHHRQ